MSGYLRAFGAELVGTFIVVWAAAGAVCADSMGAGKLGIVGVALAYGLAVAVVTWTLEPASGAHFNPAVTLAAAFTQGFDKIKTVFYLFCQLCGATLAGLWLAYVFSALPRTGPAPLGACALSGVSYQTGTLMEALVVAGLMLARLACQGRRSELALSQGAVTTLAVLLIGPLTGAALNPARAFGPALAARAWSDWFVYWVGPIVGAMAGGLAFRPLSHETLQPR